MGKKWKKNTNLLVKSLDFLAASSDFAVGGNVRAPDVWIKVRQWTNVWIRRLKTVIWKFWYQFLNRTSRYRYLLKWWDHLKNHQYTETTSYVFWYVTARYFILHENCIDTSICVKLFWNWHLIGNCKRKRCLCDIWIEISSMQFIRKSDVTWINVSEYDQRIVS